MESFNVKWMIGLGLGTVLLTMLACGTGTPPTPNATPPLLATKTSLPTASLPPLYLSVSLGDVPVKEQGTLPNYTIDAQLPVLQGSDDQRVTKFNNEMALLIQQEISVFKDNVRELAPVPNSNGSTFKVRYTLLSEPGNLISLKFDIMISIAGTANRRAHSRTVTYDLEAGSDVTLDKLFRPGSTYLQVISNYCLVQLKPKIANLVASGVDAIPSNYQNWNITSNGLMITFDEKQVATDAQQVVIPYADLKEVIDPRGPLASFQP
jgi:hypothetical protein